MERRFESCRAYAEQNSSSSPANESVRFGLRSGQSSSWLRNFPFSNVDNVSSLRLWKPILRNEKRQHRQCFASPTMFTEAEQQSATEKLALFAAQTSSALNALKSWYFQAFCLRGALRADFRPPSSHVLQKAEDQLYDETKEKLMGKLKELKCICLAFDGWEVCQKCARLAVAGIASSWTPNSFTLLAALGNGKRRLFWMDTFLRLLPKSGHWGLWCYFWQCAKHAVSHWFDFNRGGTRQPAMPSTHAEFAATRCGWRVRVFRRKGCRSAGHSLFWVLDLIAMSYCFYKSSSKTATTQEVALSEIETSDGGCEWVGWGASFRVFREVLFKEDLFIYFCI